MVGVITGIKNVRRLTGLGRAQQGQGSVIFVGCVIIQTHGRGWQGPLEVTGSNPLLRQGHAEQAAQDHVHSSLCRGSLWCAERQHHEGFI